MITDEEMAWPAWVRWMTAAFATTIAVLTPFIRGETPTSALEVVLIGGAVLPWIIEASGKALPRPVFAAGVLLPLGLLNAAANASDIQLDHDAQLSLMLVVLAAGQLAARAPRSHALVYTGFALLIPLVRFATGSGSHEWVFWVAGIVLAAGAGMVLRRQQVLLVQLKTAQKALAREATLLERRRIAREVHDVIAHSLTVSMLHITAARLSVRRNAADTEEALAEAERLGRQALHDVRSTVGLLHDATDGSTTVPLPVAGDIPALTETYVAAGLDVTLDCSADLIGVSDAGGLALYRAVQEGLSNAVKHAPGASVTISIANEGGRVVVQIQNDITQGTPHPASPGIGLRGMRERVEALGGVVVAGQRGDRWVTSCAIPVGST